VHTEAADLTARLRRARLAATAGQIDGDRLAVCLRVPTWATWLIALR